MHQLNSIIVKPKQYDRNNLAGYLLNDISYVDELIIHRPSSKFKSNIEENNNIIYNAINGLSSTPFKINTKVLDFLLNNKKEFFTEDKQLAMITSKESLTCFFLI